MPLTIASRIPEKYIVTKGAGQSDFGPGLDPWETASYDLALLDAQIENCNIVKYTSVLPPESVEISFSEAEAQGLFRHGMVLETIMAQVNGNRGDHICAGVGRAQIYDDHDNHIGGFAAEYEGHGSADLGRTMIRQALEGIFTRRYGHQHGWYMEGEQYTVCDLCVDHQYGCVLVALGFLTFIIPEL